MYRNSLLIINKCSISCSWCSSTAVRIPFTYHTLAIFNSMHHSHNAYVCACMHVWWNILSVCCCFCHRRQRTYKSSFERTKTNQKNASQFIFFWESACFLYHRHCVVFALLICNLLHVTWVIFVCRFRLFPSSSFSFSENYKRRFDASTVHKTTQSNRFIYLVQRHQETINRQV